MLEMNEWNKECNKLTNKHMQKKHTHNNITVYKSFRDIPKELVKLWYDIKKNLVEKQNTNNKRN